MHVYSWWQWLLYFYMYSIAGWIWESCYVSVKQKRWVNRGFLHLPMLPLYGSGAVVVLFATLPFRENLALVYVAGMAAATCLELITGLTMEAIYKVKYWDYSSKRFNYKGAICLEASVLWGFFSLAMVCLVHEPVAALAEGIPDTLVWVGETVVTAAFACDFYVSNRKAMQLASILTAMEKAKLEMQEDLRKMEEELAEQRRVLEERLADARGRAEEQFEARVLAAIERTEAAYQRTVRARKHLADAGGYRVEEAMRRMDDLKAGTAHTVEEIRLNVLFRNDEMLTRMGERKKQYNMCQEELLKKAASLASGMLLRNPTAVFRRSMEFTGELRRRAEKLLPHRRKYREVETDV